VTAGSDPKTLVFDWQYIISPDGVDHYQLQVSPTGDSNFTTIEGADYIVDTSFTLTIPVHLTDWVNTVYRVVALDAADNVIDTSSEIDLLTTVKSEEVVGYFKASDTNFGNSFGKAVFLSADGNTLASGADNNGGTVYLFARNGSTWQQQAYIKASNTDDGDSFAGYLYGGAVSLSADGNTLAVGASGEDSAARGINGDETDNSMDDAGAVYLFTHSNGTWQQQTYIKASNTDTGDWFGEAVSLSTDGNTLAVGAYHEASAARGVNGDETDNSMSQSGAVYLFTRSNGTWQQQAYIKASNTDVGDYFGQAVSLSSDGNTLAVGAEQESSAARGINGDETDNSMYHAGAVYLFTRNGSAWQQQAYIKASNTDARDYFGGTISLSSDGNTLTVGASGETSAARGINGDETDNSMDWAGAVYLFTRSNGTWQQDAYIKASNTDAGNHFGGAVSLSTDGNTLAVGAQYEDSAARGINGDETDNSMGIAGAVYLFTRRNSTWQQQAYVKASNTDAEDYFGGTVSLSTDGNTLVVGASHETSSARGINGDQTDNSMGYAGAVYLY
jgi:hypothetical protein